MRYLFLLAAIAAAQVGAAWAIGDTNVARPGGSYATIEADSVAGCERLCADDTLCMAWSYQANSCELKAIVPTPTEREGVTSGVSLRVPASLRAPHSQAPPPSAAPAIAAHEDRAPGAVMTADPPQDLSLALLGGPSTEESLRGGLGN
ncbi:MAG: hypothetical protein KF779_14295 [Hyphomonadaceae bacterium]|nr:hypothetical protein [Hyphomonadaceae bacterium]